MNAPLPCYAIDDQPAYLRQLKNYVQQTPGLLFAGCNRSARRGLEEMPQTGPLVLLLDIQIPDMNGLEAAQRLVHLPHVQVIFVTASPEHAVPAIKLRPADYIIKPFGYEDFLQGIQTASRILQSMHPGSPAIGIKIKIRDQHSGAIQHISATDIHYAEAAGKSVRLYLAHSTITTRSSLKELARQLPPNDFIQIHKSFLVAMPRVKGMEGEYLRLHNGARLPIGRSSLNLVKQRLDQPV